MPVNSMALEAILKTCREYIPVGSTAASSVAAGLDNNFQSDNRDWL